VRGSPLAEPKTIGSPFSLSLPLSARRALFVCFALAGSPWTKRSELSNLRPQGSQLDQTELEANSGSLRKSTQNNDQVSHQSMNPIQKLFLASSLKSEQVSLSLSEQPNWDHQHQFRAAATVANVAARAKQHTSGQPNNSLKSIKWTN